MNSQASGDILLRVYIHCSGCEETVVKCLRGFDGVEDVHVDANNNLVSIKGKKANPIKIVERLRKKSNKHVDLIFPQNPKIEVMKKEEKKKELPVIDVLLKTYLYCPRCAEDIESVIRKMKGVTEVEADMGKNLVAVKGEIEPEKLLGSVRKKTRKFVEIVSIVKQGQKDNNNNNNSSNSNNKANEKQCDQNCSKDLNSIYHSELVYAPQLFSDEDPNSCSIM